MNTILADLGQPVSKNIEENSSDKNDTESIPSEKKEGTPDTSNPDSKILSNWDTYEKYLYDIEVYPDLLLIILYNDEKFHIFEFSAYKDEIKELIEFINDPLKVVIGFNNHAYDDLIMKAIIQYHSNTTRKKIFSDLSNKSIYQLSKSIIEKTIDLGSKNSLTYKIKPNWHTSIDLLKLMSNRVSLKQLGIRLRHHSIQDLPFDPDIPLGPRNNIDIVIEYCKKDVQITSLVWERLKSKIQIRLYLENYLEEVVEKDLLDRVGNRIDLLSLNDSLLSNEILAILYASTTGMDYNEIKRYRPLIEYLVINVKDFLPSWIGFTDPDLLRLFNQILNFTFEIKKGKGDNEVILANEKEFNFSFTYARNRYIIGTGGLHSVDEPGVFISDSTYELIEIDVISFYPNIIINNKIIPESILPSWLSVFEDITNQRVEAKKNGDKIKADGLKIPINATYGKFKSQYSFFYCPKSQIKVVIIGQLSLLMLIEQLVSKGIKVISANTDGLMLLVPKGSMKDYQDVKSRWESLTSFTLEETKYKKYTRKDVNHYWAQKADGTIKEKGFQSDSNITHAHNLIIVDKAVKEYLIKGIPLEETIRKGNIHDYIVTQSIGKDFKYIHGEEELQHTNRFIITKTGDKVQKIKYDQYGTIIDKDTLFYNKPCVLMNDIKGDTHPAGINYDWYLTKAKEAAYEIQKQEIESHLKEKIELVADSLLGLELTPIPMRDKKRPKGLVLGNYRVDKDYNGKIVGIVPSEGIEKKYKFQDYPSLAIACGKKYQCITIDIDNLENMNKEGKSLLDLLMKNPSMTIWHGKGSADEVRQGRLKGKILYKTATDKIGNMNLIDTHGFEILYTNKTANVYGSYNCTEDLYNFSGNLIDLPKQILNYLSSLIPPESPKKIKAEIETDEIISLKKLKFEDYSDIIYQIFEEYGLSFNLSLIDDNDFQFGRKFIGPCPFQELHTKENHDSEFNIFITRRLKFYAECFHQSCKIDISNLQKKLNLGLKTLIKDNSSKKKAIGTHNKDPLIDYPLEDNKGMIKYKSLKEAFEEESQHKIIIAPTGFGKTTVAIETIVESIKNKRHFVYILPNKNQMGKVIEEIENKIMTSLKNERVAILKQGENDDLTKATGIITHFTYLTRKGIDTLLYTVLKYITPDSIVIIDEADAYLDQLDYRIPLSARYRVTKGQKYQYDRIDYCQVYKRSGNCTLCQNKSRPVYRQNKYHIYNYYHQKEYSEPLISPSKNESQDPNQIDISDRIGDRKFFPRYKLFISEVKQHKGMLNRYKPSFYRKKEGFPNLGMVIHNLIESSYNPVIYSFTPSLNNLPLESAKIAEERKRNNKTSDIDILEISYPSQPCGVDFLLLKDKMPLNIIKNTGCRLILMSGTFSKSNIAFCQNVLPSVKIFSIKANRPIIQDLLVIGTRYPFKFLKEIENNKGKEMSVVTDPLREYGDILIFEPTSRDSQKLFDSFPKNYPVSRTVGEDNELVYDHLKNLTKEWHTLISHSRGIYGRGHNMPDFCICFVNGLIYKPCISAKTDKSGYGIEEILENDRLTMIIQNAGRILRINEGDTEVRKVIVISNTTEEELDTIIKESDWRHLCINQTRLFYEHDMNLIVQSAETFLETGWCIKYDEKTYRQIAIAKAIEVGVSRLNKSELKLISKEDLEDIKHKKNEIKRNKKIEKIMLKISTLFQGNPAITRSEIHKKCNINRLDEDSKRKITELIDQLLPKK